MRKILITNDDGIDSPGIIRLEKVEIIKRVFELVEGQSS